MFTQLISHPRLIPSSCQTRHAQEHSKRDPYQCRHHRVSRSALSFHPFLDLPARLWILQPFIQVYEAGTKVMVGYVSFIGVANGEADSKRVQLGLKEEVEVIETRRDRDLGSEMGKEFERFEC